MHESGNKKQICIARLGECDTFGEEALLSLSAQAKRTASLHLKFEYASITRRTFEKLVDSNTHPIRPIQQIYRFLNQKLLQILTCPQDCCFLS